MHIFWTEEELGLVHSNCSVNRLLLLYKSFPYTRKKMLLNKEAYIKHYD